MALVPESAADDLRSPALPARLGVLGGMGPLATVDFLGRLIAATPARNDADHIPVIVWSVPQVPDRRAAIDGSGQSPLPMMVEGLRALAYCGAVRAVIVCNTAHYWYDELVAQGGLPILHIADAASEAILDGASAGAPGGAVALFATRGTHEAGFYAPRLAARGHRLLAPDEQIQRACIDPAIAAVKAHRLQDAGVFIGHALVQLAAQGVDTVVLGCTELPLAYAALAPMHRPAGLRIVDATDALAQACVRAWRPGVRQAPH
jgi:aspartate racemase